MLVGTIIIHVLSNYIVQWTKNDMIIVHFCKIINIIILSQWICLQKINFFQELSLTSLLIYYWIFWLKKVCNFFIVHIEKNFMYSNIFYVLKNIFKFTPICDNIFYENFGFDFNDITYGHLYTKILIQNFEIYESINIVGIVFQNEVCVWKSPSNSKMVIWFFF
jgi:hypothetical protein